MPPRIRIPRNLSSQALSRRHRRNLKYAFGVAFFVSLVYVWSGPIDPLAISYYQHELYMNDRADIDDFVSNASFDWRKALFANPITEYILLPKGEPQTLSPVQFPFPRESQRQRTKREMRRVAVRKEFERSWDSYKAFAWTQDELLPIAGAGQESFGGWGATLVDALDTLWIMGLKKEFYEAVGAVAAIDFGQSTAASISVFETTIRYLGGLLAAYDLSHEKVLLEKSVQVGEMLYHAFDTEPNNTPLNQLNLEQAKNGGLGFTAEGRICFAAIGSLAMEFTRLAQITGQAKYYDAVARVTNFLDRIQNTTQIPGLFPTYLNTHTQNASMGSSFTAGAMADSSYEYFPKMHALLGGLEPVYLKLWKDSAAMIDKYMLFRPLIQDPNKGEDLLFCGDVNVVGDEIQLSPEMQHLTCFIGGMYGLGGRLFSDSYHVELGAKLTHGCIYAYRSMPTGVMPEVFNVAACSSRTDCAWNDTMYEEAVLSRTYGSDHEEFLSIVAKQKLPSGFTELRDKRYLLRPEAIESVFIMYRITGHEEYLEAAWNMFVSIVKATKTQYGNGQIVDVTVYPPAIPEDKMESFWLAETLKYFYLIFSPPDMISLDDWVFNTEAHPFRRPNTGKSSKAMH